MMLLLWPPSEEVTIVGDRGVPLPLGLILCAPVSSLPSSVAGSPSLAAPCQPSLSLVSTVRRDSDTSSEGQPCT